jgi:hypothetical protein
MRTAYLYNFIKRWIFVFAVFVLILMNFLANAIPFGGETMAEVSAKYPTLITPAGYAFSIWGIIYLTLAVFALFQLFKGKEIRFYKLVWPYFLINAGANCLWLVAFQNEWFTLSIALMAVILISLIAIFKLFYRLKKILGTTHRYFFQVPFSLYFGWVSIASIVNVAVWFVAMDVQPILRIDEILSVSVLVFGALIGLWILITQKDFIFNFALVWAFVAIWAGQDEVMPVIHAAKFSAIGLTAAMIIRFIGDRVKVAQYGKSTSRQ